MLYVEATKTVMKVVPPGAEVSAEIVSQNSATL